MTVYPESWRELFVEESAKAYFAALSRFVDEAYAAAEVYPPKEKIFAALELTPMEKTRVVILGQDPYHEPGQAQGLAFYVPAEVKTPPSLVNIAKELKAEAEGLNAAELKAKAVTIPDLGDWARQGVLLLNATLTVAKGKPLSHRGQGWEKFTDAAIAYLNEHCEHLVFLLWGAEAQKKGAAIDRTRHLVIECAHPSPLSARRGFFGSDCFKKCNEYLQAHGKGEIRWRNEA